MEDLFKCLLQAIFETATIDPKWLKFGGGENAALLDAVRTVWKYIGFFGMALTLIYFLIEINSKLALEGAQNMTLKSFMAPFLKLVIACSILHNAGHIVGALLSVNDAMVDKAKTVFTGSTTVTDTDGDGISDENQEVFDNMNDVFKDFNLVEKCLVVIVTILVWIVSLVLQVVWIYKAMTYKLEVLWRTAITPTAFADVYSGTHSNMLRWMKGFIGLTLYAMAIIVLPQMAMLLSIGGSIGSLTNADIWMLLRALVTSIIAPFAALGVMSTIKQMCKEALG
jgi:hypothetical protein